MNTNEAGIDYKRLETSCHNLLTAQRGDQVNRREPKPKADPAKPKRIISFTESSLYPSKFFRIEDFAIDPTGKFGDFIAQFGGKIARYESDLRKSLKNYDPKRLFAWAQELDLREISKVEKVCGDAIQALGYKTVGWFRLRKMRKKLSTSRSMGKFYLA